MNRPKFKYNINHLISLMPRHIAISDLETLLRETHGISRGTFYSDRNITIDSESSIPLDRLETYATVFGCTVEHLLNYKPKKGKSIIQVMSEKSERSKSVRTGLK